jgi:hypothetical protein
MARASFVLVFAGAALLVCALIGMFVHPEQPPEQGALVRSENLSSSIGPGPQFCGRPGPAIGHRGSWVIELLIDGREHCVVVYPKSDAERHLFEHVAPTTPLRALHSDTAVWQVESPEGVLVDYATRRAEAKAALASHGVRQAMFFCLGAIALGLGFTLRNRARARQTTAPASIDPPRPQPGDSP